MYYINTSYFICDNYISPEIPIKKFMDMGKKGGGGPTERENYVPHKFSQDFHTVINDINNEIIKFIKKNQHD